MGVVFNFPEPNWVKCDSCEELFTSLVSVGDRQLCWDCRDGQQADDDARRKADRRRMLLRAGVPDLFSTSPFQEPGSWPADRRAPEIDLASWMGEPPLVAITGPVGPGKSMLGVELLWRGGLRLDRSVAFVRAARIPTLYFTAEGREQFERVLATDVAMIDDLGRGHPGEAWQAVSEVVAERHQHRRPTIVTTNLSIEQIGDHDAGIADRLLQGLIVKMTGESRRDLELRET